MEGKFDSDLDDSYDTFLPGSRIPPLKTTGYISYEPIAGWQNRLQVLYSGNRDPFEGDAADAFGQGPVDAYTTVDLQVALNLNTLGFGKGTFRLGVENITDNFYYPTISQWYNLGFGYSAAPGRQVTLSYAINL